MSGNFRPSLACDDDVRIRRAFELSSPPAQPPVETPRGTLDFATIGMNVVAVLLTACILLAALVSLS